MVAIVRKLAPGAGGCKAPSISGGTDMLNGSVQGMVECVTKMTEHVMAPQTAGMERIVRDKLKDTIATISYTKRVLDGVVRKFSDT